MNIASFRTRVEQALTAAVPLGVYTLPGGQTTPAISVGEPPEGTTADGLEVLISPTPKPQIFASFAGNTNLPLWQVRLINHDGPSAPFSAALDALLTEFWPMPTPQYIPEAGDIAEQALLSIPDDLEP